MVTRFGTPWSEDQRLALRDRDPDQIEETGLPVTSGELRQLRPVQVLTATRARVACCSYHTDVHVLPGLTSVDEHVQRVPTVRRVFVCKRKLDVLLPASLREKNAGSIPGLK